MRRQIIHCLLAASLMQCMFPCALAQTGEVPENVQKQPQNTTQSTGNTAANRSNLRTDPMVQNGSGCQSARRCDEDRSVYRRPRRVQYDDEADHSAAWRANRRRRGRHALIGAIIGFGIGAAIGAKGNQDQHTRARVGAPLLGGAIGASIGAAIGATHP